MSRQCELWGTLLISTTLDRSTHLLAVQQTWGCGISEPQLVATKFAIGNVSYAVPGFHGIFTIETDGVNHTPQFTNGAGSDESYQRSLYCAAGMAVVACQILTDDALAEAVRRDFKKD